ncbi:ATP-dependent metalloprotease FtsH [Sulfobacillus acidophilus TPY]|uniref:ATP-dependent zinc metalloprotease FtsH n=1 Tax=Sulfobacillus acidophilus (strain ATCC 700253 / DSM 10332 / NAL) TaxID=679936 RepID=G8TTR1_SULAD|nr:ATP-dependent metalloprotease FtsH [Sulfobacillus acidophilus TPY]AEW06820.1 ATP-dependent metalloprotease FtsH [Sulfobacillus acidophilus DSM 10332]
MQNRWLRGLLTIVFVVLIVSLLMEFFNAPTQQTSQTPYSTLISDTLTNQVTQATVEPATHTVLWTDRSGKHYLTVYPTGYTNELSNDLNDHGAVVTITKPPGTGIWMTVLGDVLPLIVVVGLVFFLVRQGQGGNRMMSFGRSQARLINESQQRVTFADVAGLDEEKQELEEVVDFLKNPKRYLEMGARIPKGVLLYGPPGTGKTLLARAVAGEAGVPFFSESGSGFVEMFVGVGASRVRDLFDQAKKNAPCIVFIDELDAVGRMRGAGYGGGNDEREQTLNQLLVEMDGFGVNEGIILMAATNRPDVLDPALLRPGRFDRQIVVHAPDLAGRIEILKVHTRNKPLASDVDLAVIAKRTPGFTGADLANLANEAALLAARERQKRITMANFIEATERVMAGPQKKTRVLSNFEKRVVAFHESGHTLVGMLVPHGDPIHKVTIIPRGMAMGYTLPVPDEDRYRITREQFLDKVAMSLGGRAAEQIVFGEISTGASDDLEKSTRMVRQMIMEYGMSDELGPITYGRRQEVFLGRDLMRQQDYSDEVAAKIDQAIRHVIVEQYERAKSLLMQHRQTLNRLALALLEKETLESDELRQIVFGA